MLDRVTEPGALQKRTLELGRAFPVTDNSKSS